MRNIICLGLGSLMLFAAPATAQIQPGKWQQEIQTVDIKAPGLPPQMLQAMKMRPISTSHCVTPEEAANGPGKMLEKDSAKGSECKQVRYNMSGGKLDSVLECKGDKNEKMRITMRGNYTPTSYDITAVMDGMAPIEQITTRMKARHAGPCS